jgi:hypothetical protein
VTKISESGREAIAHRGVVVDDQDCCHGRPAANTVSSSGAPILMRSTHPRALR